MTKAKLDDIRIAGDCLCEEKPLPKYDITILVDSSDSYDGKVFIDGKLADNKAFIETQKLIESKLIEKLQKKIGSRASFELIQFGGIKQLTPSYKPGSGGDAGSGGLRHYQVEVAKTSLDRASRRGRFADSLDGNGQLFLCLQDLNLRQMSSGRHQVLIIFTDEEWDLNGLKDHMGRLADRSTVHRSFFKQSKIFLRSPPTPLATSRRTQLLFETTNYENSKQNSSRTSSLRERGTTRRSTPKNSTKMSKRPSKKFSPILSKFNFSKSV